MIVASPNESNISDLTLQAKNPNFGRRRTSWKFSTEEIKMLFLQMVAKRWPEDFFNFEPWLHLNLGN